MEQPELSTLETRPARKPSRTAAQMAEVAANALTAVERSRTPTSATAPVDGDAEAPDISQFGKRDDTFASSTAKPLRSGTARSAAELAETANKALSRALEDPDFGRRQASHGADLDGTGHMEAPELSMFGGQGAPSRSFSGRQRRFEVTALFAETALLAAVHAAPSRRLASR
jgi:hypothetical protein